jgi:hypothetical protein
MSRIRLQSSTPARTLRGTTRRALLAVSMAVASMGALTACNSDDPAPTAPPGATTGRLVVSIDQNSCAGVITGAPLAEVFINGAGRGRFTLLLDAIRAYDLMPGNYNVSTRINDITIGTPRSVRINAGEDTSFLFFCI